MAACGELRVGVMAAAHASPFLVTIHPISGRPEGVTVSLGEAFARALERSPRYIVYHSLSALEEGAARHAYDLSFMPITPRRELLLEFGPAYFRFTNTMLVRASSALRRVDDVDRPEIRIAVQADSLHHQELANTLRNATLVALDSLEGLARHLNLGDADVVAHATPVLATMQRRLGNARLLEGNLSSTALAVAVPYGGDVALNLVNQIMRSLIGNGFVTNAIRNAGLRPDGSCYRD